MTVNSSYDRCKQLALESPNLEKPYLCKPDAGHFFFPNEYFPERISCHYADQENGIHIATGAERFFFNAITCKERDFFLNIDIDSHIKAYVDINILFLIISDSQLNYIDLIQKRDNDATSHKINESPHLSQKWKSYYLKYLATYGAIFYVEKNHFINRTEGRYYLENQYRSRLRYHEPLIAYHAPGHKNDFDKLQKLAREGKLLSICHSITDLTWINPEEIAEIDTSNIEDYAALHFRFASRPKHPIRVIRATGFGQNTCFASWLYTPLSEEKREELQTLQNRLFKVAQNTRTVTALSQTAFMSLIAEVVLEKNSQGECSTNSPSRMSDCVSVLPIWKQFASTHLIGNDQLGEFLCVKGCFDVERLNNLDIATVKEYFTAHPLSQQATDFLKLIANVSPVLNTVLLAKPPVHSLPTNKTNENNPDASQRATPAA